MAAGFRAPVGRHARSQVAILCHRLPAAPTPPGHRARRFARRRPFPSVSPNPRRVPPRHGWRAGWRRANSRTEDGVADAACCPLPASRFPDGTCSPSWTRYASTVPTGNSSPTRRALSGMRRMPLSSDSTSVVALSLSTRKRYSPSFTGSPSCLSHSTTVPASTFQPSRGMTTSIATHTSSEQ